MKTNSVRLILTILILFVGFKVGFGCCDCCCCGCTKPMTSMPSMNMTMCTCCDCCCDCCGCGWAARKKRDSLFELSTNIKSKEENSNCNCEDCNCKECDCKTNAREEAEFETLLITDGQISTTPKTNLLIDKTVIIEPKFKKFTTRANRVIHQR